MPKPAADGKNLKFVARELDDLNHEVRKRLVAASIATFGGSQEQALAAISEALKSSDASDDILYLLRDGQINAAMDLILQGKHRK